MIIGINQHKKLRKLGFPIVERCKDATTSQDVIYKFPMPYNEYEMRLPKFRGDISIHEALDWIRDEKGIACGVYPFVEETKEEGDSIIILYEFRFIHYYRNTATKINNLHCKVASFKTYSIAESNLLDELLTYLEANNHGNK